MNTFDYESINDLINDAYFSVGSYILADLSKQLDIDFGYSIGSIDILSSISLENKLIQLIKSNL